MPLTADRPKSFTEIAGRRILDWTLDAFRRNGLQRFVFVAGYLEEVVNAAYPDFRYVVNPDWASTNMLHSLMCARDDLAGGFYSTYTDTLFRDDAVGDAELEQVLRGQAQRLGGLAHLLGILPQDRRAAFR